MKAKRLEAEIWQRLLMGCILENYRQTFWSRTEDSLRQKRSMENLPTTDLEPEVMNTKKNSEEFFQVLINK